MRRRLTLLAVAAMLKILLSMLLTAVSARVSVLSAYLSCSLARAHAHVASGTDRLLLLAQMLIYWAAMRRRVALADQAQAQP